MTTTTAAARAHTVDGVLRRSAARTPDRTALVFGADDPRTWTYAQLDRAVTHAARGLRERGLDRGDRVAAYGTNSDAYLVGYLACARAGLVHVPVNYALKGEELAYLLGQSGARAVLVDPALRADLDAVLEDLSVDLVLALRDADDTLLALATDPGADADAPVLPAGEAPVAEDELVQLLYTSGTTSRPKGAMMTHRALLAEYVSAITALDLGPDDDPLHPMPLYHSAQMHVFLLPSLAVGATNHLVETPDVPTLLRLVEERGLGSLFLAPTVWVPLAGHPDLATRDLSSLRKAFYGASIMPVPVLERLQRQLPGLGFYNCFGQSEIGPLATVLRPEEHAERPDSCGRAVLNVELAVLDGDGAPVPAGEQGEVVYRSPQLCEGYWDDPTSTAEAFRDGWFHSGDLVTVDAAGYLTVVDRIKDVINTGGVLVASREVEDALYTHPDVAEVAVVGTPDERWIEAVTAYVVLRDGAAVTPEALVAHARERLSGFKTPKQVHLVGTLPRNASGKLLKRVLRDGPA
ncbi:fatty acyl-CoA synthetase [Nocardioides zeae]|uniref:Fatty acyl-CoA synthetase n=1 Tax=Nocardioides imazamoxiresistens TaxID=3231893 RepID=A0ABU3PYV8_9ACTN|nr:fatty acyl-CoA synthetase [Nocardioides zeae]MDT9594361.1 fatty acyl-CoA synthetase [Nocardioides zeae]